MQKHCRAAFDDCHRLFARRGDPPEARLHPSYSVRRLLSEVGDQSAGLDDAIADYSCQPHAEARSTTLILRNRLTVMRQA